MMSRFSASASLFVLAALAGAPNALAQEQSGESDEIVVTARLRSETLQDVPMSVDVATSESLERVGATSLLDLPRAAPGLVVMRGVDTKTNITIRGLGSTPASAAFESSIGFFVDGAYVPRTREFSTSLFDVERVEVVRGTQGSLLGKNTSLGAVNVVTRSPGDSFEANLAVAREFELESWTVNGGVSVPLTDTLSIRVAGLYDDQGGWVHNAISGNDSGASERAAGRFVLAWTPSAAFDATLRYETQEVEIRGTLLEYNSVAGSGANGLATLAGFSDFEGDLDRDNFDTDSRDPFGSSEDLNVDRAWLTAHWNFGGYQLTSQTVWADSEGRWDGGVDFLPGDYYYSEISSPSSSVSQEFRLASPVDWRFRYVAGVWFGSNDFEQILTQTTNYPAGFGPGGIFGGPNAWRNNFDQNTESWSVFVQGDYDLTERLTASAGLRYSDESKEATFSRITLVPGFLSTVSNPPYAPFTLSRDESSVDGVVSLRYEASDNLMFYAAWAQGTKSGGYSEAVTFLEQSEFDPEVARTTELGVRFQSSDRQITANATVFSTEVTDYQLSDFNGVAFAVRNTDLTSVGVESEVVWRPAAIPGLRVDWSNTYAQAEDAITGADIPRAPEWAGGLQVSYEQGLNDHLNLVLSAGVDYMSGFTHNTNPALVPSADPVEMINASIGLESGQGYAIRLVGQNLTDENRSTFSFPAPLLAGNSVAASERPRTVALQLSYNY